MVLALAAGDLASIRAGVVTRERATDIASAGAWRDGILVFRDQPLSRVARELARWGQPLIVVPALDLQARGDSLVVPEK